MFTLQLFAFRVPENLETPVLDRVEAPYQASLASRVGRVAGSLGSRGGKK